MIGGRRSGRAQILGVAAAVALGGLLAARPLAAERADPPLAAERRALLLDAASRVEEALDELIASLQTAIDDGRHGAALVIQGDEPADPLLRSAAEVASTARQQALAVQRAAQQLGGIAASVAPDTALPAGVSPNALLGVDAQLEEAATQAPTFVTRRQAASQTIEALGAALAALDEVDVDAALDQLAAARRARSVVAAWPEPPVVLPFWLRTTGAMLDAARDIARAALDGDVQAAEAAGRAYRAAARDARQADTALALVIAESGSGLTATPLARLADALARATRQRAAAASVLE
ncbi:MAG TPA: hypothetical protein VH987_09065 [Candidatus Limnocylindria bacterium]|jgi:hypothetical protein